MIGHLGVRYLEAFICCLIGLMSLCFFWNAAHAGHHAWEGLVVGWAVPSAPSYAFTQVHMRMPLHPGAHAYAWAPSFTQAHMRHAQASLTHAHAPSAQHT